MSLERIKYSIVVPVYNSSNIMEELINQVRSAMEKVGYSFELILVDDGSTDAVWDKIKDLASRFAFIRGLRLSNNFGQWMATMAGISRAQGKYIITMDDDLEYDPADILTLIENYSKGDYYLIFGLAEDKYKLQGKLSLIALWRSRLINVIWQKFLTDSFKLFSRDLVFDGDEFVPKVHFEAFANVTLAPHHVGYCKVRYRKRFAGSSNHTLMKKIKLFFEHSLEYYQHPGLGFSMIFTLVALAVIVSDHLLFGGKFNGSLIAFISLAGFILLLLILQYAARVYHRINGIPDYWIIEDTSDIETRQE